MGWQEDLANFPLTQEEVQQRAAQIQAQQQAMQAQSKAAQQATASTNGIPIMAGGGSIGPLTVGSMYANTHSAAWLGDAEKQRIRHDAIIKERNEIVDMIKGMAEEIGAPTLLHAITLAISLRDEPEE